MTDTLEDRIRRTLRTVADRVPDTLPDRPPAPGAPRARRRRRGAVALTAALVSVPVAAGAVVMVGPEYVDAVPPAGVIASATVDGEVTWMVDAFHEDDCGNPMPGVELVAESRNLLGREWDTQGVSYGDVDPQACTTELAGWLDDPTRYEVGGRRSGDGWVLVAAVHPDVDAVRLVLDGAARDVPVHARDGAGYALLAVPPGTDDAASLLLVDGRVLAGSLRDLSPRRPEF